MTTQSYLQSLRDQGKERVRLTRQLQQLVSSALDVIAEECQPGTSVKVPGSRLELTVVSQETALGTHRLVVLEPEPGHWDKSRRLFDAGRQPWAKWFLDGDFGCEVSNASRDQWLTVAGALPAIAAGFLREDTKVRDAMRIAIRNLRVWSDNK